MEKGWVKSHRRMLENDFLMHDNNAYLVFTKLLLMVGKEKGQWAGGRRQLGELMNLNHSTLYKVLIRLEDNGMIKIESKVRYSTITIVNWQQYQQTDNREVTDSRTLAQQGENVALVTDEVATREPHGNHTVTTRGHSNKNKKENKKILTSNEVGKPTVYGNPEINGMFDYWQEQLGYALTAKRQMNRNACSNLIKKHGADGLKALIRGVAASHEDKYSGVHISDFIELQANTNKLMAWGRKKTVATQGEMGIILT